MIEIYKTIAFIKWERLISGGIFLCELQPYKYAKEMRKEQLIRGLNYRNT